jgi:NADPH:quinone reductase-like Zn-dependent oxidoreductase
MAASGNVGMGWDLADVVDALGPGVDRFKAGDASGRWRAPRPDLQLGILRREARY